jgi:hypothetical protein
VSSASNLTKYPAVRIRKCYSGKALSFLREKDDDIVGLITNMNLVMLSIQNI